MRPGHPAARAVLIDLDGPLTRLFPDPSHLELAAGLADLVARRTGWRPEQPGDHVQVLRSVADADPGVIAELATAAETAEIEAARRAEPARGARDFLFAANRAGYAVAVVSNNAEAAVRIALEECGFAALVRYVAARHGGNVAGLKPAPDLLVDALSGLDASPDDGVFFGDTVSDMVAANAAGVRAVGVAPWPDRTRDLLASGAELVVPDLGDAIPLVSGGLAVPAGRPDGTTRGGHR